ncbi:TetR/AcrR family transcriptional regulator [Motilimonas sp. KMU-193]|uniref:TetR/AcrR family transcriptional regulator n=1 Tax=Motilimonas sp. KMU-193 TaxID=3388668 RepID=UPI00396B3CF5
MAWKIEHKQQTRQRILQSAGQLFTTLGFKQVSIDDVMQHAKLTRGAFYHHFASKQALYCEAIVFFAQHSSQARQQQADSLQEVIYLYLSMDHVTGKLSPCPLAFLISDIGLEDQLAKDSYGLVFDALVKRLSEASAVDQVKATQAAITMIGAVALARTMQSETQTASILAAARSNTLHLLGLTSDRSCG